MSGPARQTILLLEPHDGARLLLTTVLERVGHRVVAATDGRDALRRFYAERPGLVLVELSGSAADGWHVLERVREMSDVPVIVVTDCTGEIETVRALRMGADDYVTKPFRNGELVARIESVLRRAAADTAPEVHDDGLVQIDVERRTVSVAGRAVRLTPLEFRLLLTMVRHRGHVLSRDQLLQLVWNDPMGGSGDEVRVYIGYLRRKLAAVLGTAPIETVRGFGYRYEPELAAAAVA